MILGAVSFSPVRNREFINKVLVGTSMNEGLVFNDVNGKWLNGGFFLSPDLPSGPEDFCYTDTDILVLFSGSLYNKAELAASAGTTADMPDPALIARLFLREGIGFVNCINGDFVFYIEQFGVKEAYLVRDHVGIRPMAFSEGSDSLLFSSDITGLSRFVSGGRNIDCEYLMGWFKSVDKRRAPCSKVKKLLPGHYLHYCDGKVQTFRYWKPEKIKTDRSLQHDKMLKDLDSILRDAVRIRCDVRYTAGAHVSGGLDSAIVSTLAREEYRDQNTFPGFSWSHLAFTPADLKFDERELIKEFCKAKGITPWFSDLDRNDFLKKVDDSYYNHMYFFEDRVLETAERVGVNLIFSGWGGDDFISAGDRGIEIDLLRGLRFRTFLHRNPIRPVRRFVKYFLSDVVYPLLGILDPSTTRSLSNRARWLREPFKKSDRRAIRNFFFFSSRRQLHLRLLESYHIQERCESWSVMGHRKGIEYRYPLLDKRIIEYMLKVPSELLCKTDYFRPLLREIGKDLLPEEIRMNWSKYDEVYWTYIKELYKVSAESLIEEVHVWISNPELRFVDFGLLTRDIKDYRENKLEPDVSLFFRTLVYLKEAHMFSVVYNWNR